MSKRLLSLLSYWFWPNPGSPGYGSLKVQLLLAMGAAMVLASIGLSVWRRRARNPMTRTLSRSWASAAMTFGLVSLVLTLSRVEMIQFLAMRALWMVWGIVLAFYVAFQVWQFKRRHYVVVTRQHVADVKDKYLPKRKS